MKILFIPNWTVRKSEVDDPSIQAPDKLVDGEEYWFFKYFRQTTVDIIDIHSANLLSALERKIKFYIWQSILAFKIANNYDVVISHGAQSGLLYELLSSFFPRAPKHIMIDVGGLNGAKTGGGASKILSFILRKRPQIVIHSSRQISLYRDHYPQLVDGVHFIPFGVDLSFFSSWRSCPVDSDKVVSFGYAKRDYPTLVKAWNQNPSDRKLLKVIGVSHLDQVESRIEVIPKTSLECLLDEIQSSAYIIIALPEYNYSYGQMSFLQSMAMGKMVIVTQTTSSIDYLKDAPGVLLADPYSVDSMLACIAQMDSLSIEEIERRGQMNKEYVKQFFNEEQMAASLYQLCVD